MSKYEEYSKKDFKKIDMLDIWPQAIPDKVGQQISHNTKQKRW